MKASGHALVAFAAFVALAASVPPSAALSAQEPEGAGEEVRTPPAEDTIPAPEAIDVPGAAVRGGQAEEVSPRSAFLRSLALPGWGHVTVGSYTRGAFYFSAESAVGWMLYRSVRRFDHAERIRELRRAEVAARLREEGVVDPRELADRVADDPAVQSAEDLVDSRSEQREDWIALGIFLLLLGAADAYVSAHLQDFPEPVQLEALPLPDGGGVQVGIRVPVSVFIR